jgi:hypothetical protein
MSQYRSLANQAVERDLVRLIIENTHKISKKQTDTPTLQLGPFAVYHSLPSSAEFMCIKILHNIFKDKANCQKLIEIPELETHLYNAMSSSYKRLAAFVSHQ